MGNFAPMKKKALLIAVLVLPALHFSASAKSVDTTLVTHTNSRGYADEPGFFQKANRDLSDPRFMFHDAEHNLDLGIGGTVQAGFLVNVGGLPDYNFKPGMISVPTERSLGFAGDVSDSELYAKARATVLGRKVIAFLSIGGNSDNSISIKKAYVSVGGLSIGMIPSFVNDLEYGVMTRMCINTQCSVTQPLIGYTYRAGKGLELAAAIENPVFKAGSYNIPFVLDEYQPVPDFSFHAKLRWSRGHIQLGGVYRALGYWATDEYTTTTSQGEECTSPGYALSLSGNFKVTGDIKIAWSAMQGLGASRYINFFKGLPVDVGLADFTIKGYPVLKSLPMMSASLSGQYNLRENLSFSLITGYGQIWQRKNVTGVSDTRNVFFASVNCFWYPTDFVLAGVECLTGMRSTYPDGNSGWASRLSILFAYQF